MSCLCYSTTFKGFKPVRNLFRDISCASSSQSGCLTRWSPRPSDDRCTSTGGMTVGLQVPEDYPAMRRVGSARPFKK